MKTISCKLSNTFKAADLVPNNQKFQDERNNEHDVRLETNAAALCKLLVEEKKSDLRIIYLCIFTTNTKRKRKKKHL